MNSCFTFGFSMDLIKSFHVNSGSLFYLRVSNSLLAISKPVVTNPLPWRFPLQPQTSTPGLADELLLKQFLDGQVVTIMGGVKVFRKVRLKEQSCLSLI